VFRSEAEPLLALYRGHWIFIFLADRWSSEITERATAEILPTNVSANLAEGPLLAALSD